MLLYVEPTESETRSIRIVVDDNTDNIRIYWSGSLSVFWRQPIIFRYLKLFLFIYFQ